MGSSPSPSSLLSMWSMLGILFGLSLSLSFSLSLSLPLSLSLYFSLSKKKKKNRGPWVAQSVERSDFGPGHDPVLCGFEPRFRLCADSSDSVSPSPSAPPLLARCVSVSQK